jgi:hypothetical protein
LVDQPRGDLVAQGGAEVGERAGVDAKRESLDCPSPGVTGAGCSWGQVEEALDGVEQPVTHPFAVALVEQGDGEMAVDGLS